MGVEHVSFPSIEQYRNVCKLVRERAQHDSLPLPRLTFYGSVKLHGTNAGIGFTDEGEMWAQSRSLILTPEADHMGFAAWVRDNASAIPPLKSAVIFGEWCGGNIQKGVAIGKLPKMFVPFAVLQADRWWSPAEMKSFFFHSGLRCIYDFPNWERVIDFNRPEEYQNDLGELTKAVEAECPVAKELGVSGVGEGIVWWAEHRDDFNTDGLVFKVKGEKHSETHVKTLAAVDVEKIANVRLLVDTLVTQHRLEKKLDDLKEQGLEVDIKNTGQFLKLVTGDVMKEEADTIAASGLPQTDVMRGVSMRAKQFFMEAVNAIPL
jgi:hypothetical protein